jgi:hypothetical protein
LDNIFEDDDDQYLENSDEDEDLDLEDDSDEEDSDPEDEEQPRKKGGDPWKALQEERAKSRQLKEDLKRHQALLERLPQVSQQQPQQVSSAQQREYLQTLMLERPEEYHALVMQQNHRLVQSELSRLSAREGLKKQVPSLVKQNKEFNALYQDPQVKEIIDNFVDDQIHNGVIENAGDLKEVLTNTMSALGVIRGVGGSKNPARDRATSIVGRGSSGGRSSVENIWAEKQQLAKSNPKKYVEWAQSEEGRKVRQALYKMQ